VSINPVDVRYYANDLVASQSSGGASMSWRGVTTITPGAVSPGGYNDPDEFGNARNSAETRTGPADGTSSGRYDWLGGEQGSRDALAGTMLMGVRVYAPALGRFLQVDLVPGGGDNAYDYCGQDPSNCYGLHGRFGLKHLRKAGSWVKKHRRESVVAVDEEELTAVRVRSVVRHRERPRLVGGSADRRRVDEPAKREPGGPFVDCRARLCARWTRTLSRGRRPDGTRYANSVATSRHGCSHDARTTSSRVDTPSPVATPSVCSVHTAAAAVLAVPSPLSWHARRSRRCRRRDVGGCG
jgi:RHS repeat-associated protein